MLVATDGSRSADAAVTFAIDGAVCAGRALDIVSVSVTRSPSDPVIAPTRVERYGGSRGIVDDAAVEAFAAGVREVATHTPHGDPEVEILRVADRQGSVEIVLGRFGADAETRGRDGP